MRGLTGDGATSDAGPSSSDSAYESSTDAGCVSDTASTRSNLSSSVAYSSTRYGNRGSYSNDGGRRGDVSPRPYYMTYPSPSFPLMPSATLSPNGRDGEIRDHGPNRNPSLVSSSSHSQQMYRSATGHSSLGVHLEQRQISYGDEPGRGPRLKIPSPLHPQINHHHHHHHQHQQQEEHDQYHAEHQQQQKHHQKLTAASPSHLLSPNAASAARDTYWSQPERGQYIEHHQLSPRSPRSSVIMSESSGLSSFPSYYPSAPSSSMAFAESLSVSTAPTYSNGGQPHQRHMMEMSVPSSQSQLSSPVYLSSSRRSPIFAGEAGGIKQEQSSNLGHIYNHQPPKSEHHHMHLSISNARQHQHQGEPDLHRSPDMKIKEETKAIDEDSKYKTGSCDDQKQSDSDYCSDRDTRDNGSSFHRALSPALCQEKVSSVPQDLSQSGSLSGSKGNGECLSKKDNRTSAMSPTSLAAAPSSPPAHIFKHPQHQSHYSNMAKSGGCGSKFNNSSNESHGSRLNTDGVKSVSQSFYASPASIIADLAKNDNLLSIAEDYQIDQFTGSEESVAQALCMVGDNIVMRFVHWMKHLPFCR